MPSVTDELSSLGGRRRRVAAVAFGPGSLTMGVAETIHPRGGAEEAAGLLHAFAAELGTWTAWALLLVATSPLQLPGVLAWRRDRTPAATPASSEPPGSCSAADWVALFAFGQSHGEGVARAGSELIDPALEAAYPRADSPWRSPSD